MTRPGQEEPIQPKPPLSAEAEQDVRDAYVAGMGVAEILNAWEIHTGILYPLLKQAGIPLRGNAARRRPAPRKESQMPTPSIAAVPSLNGASTAALPEWTVTYLIRKTETVTVAAKSFNDAAAAIEAGTLDIEVISVTKANV